MKIALAITVAMGLAAGALGTGAAFGFTYTPEMRVSLHAASIARGE